ncbi:MAG TPA: hypothetical protein VFI69_08150 [Candidatus Limnocylindrales bacterium]|jgi:hypothetical protein|nr:hypothetical protein [Candidatus Limnocylindrales bacterium]
MDPADIIMLPRPRTAPFDRGLLDIDAAIELVVRGAAVRVRLTGMPEAGDLASIGLARAQAVDLGFSAERDAGGLTLTIGPRNEPRRR